MAPGGGSSSIWRLSAQRGFDSDFGGSRWRIGRRLAQIDSVEVDEAKWGTGSRSSKLNHNFVVLAFSSLFNGNGGEVEDDLHLGFFLRSCGTSKYQGELFIEL